MTGLYKKFFSLLRIIRNHLRLKKVLFQTHNYGGVINHHIVPDLAVPLKCNGIGTINLKGKVSFGNELAPMISDGRIILQARSTNSNITIGSGTFISNNVVLIANSSIHVGENCRIGDMICIYDCDFHEVDPNTRNNSAGVSIPVNIGQNVWIGSRAMIFKGVSIGDNSVIAAGSIVSKSIPSNSLAAGIPAKVIRKI